MTRLSIYLALSAVLTWTTCTALASERRINRSQLPAAVQKTVEMESRDATIRGFATETEGGKKVYEAEMIVKGHTKDIQIAEDGTLNEIEEEVSIESLPSPVQTALRSRAGSAKIMKVESLTKHGALVAYEASTLKGSKRGEIQVGPNGEKLAHLE
jgi:hypothetical protein